MLFWVLAIHYWTKTTNSPTPLNLYSSIIKSELQLAKGIKIAGDKCYGNKQNRSKGSTILGWALWEGINRVVKDISLRRWQLRKFSQGGERGPRELVGRLCLLLDTPFLHSAEGLYYWHLPCLQPSRTTGFPNLPWEISICQGSEPLSSSFETKLRNSVCPSQFCALGCGFLLLPFHI